MIAKLQAMLGMDSTKFNAETRKAGNSVDKVGKGLGKIKGLIAGAFGVGVIMSFGKKMLKLGDDMATTATTFNITIESVLAMQAAMAESGIATEQFLKILGNLRKSQYEVGRGTATYADAVKALNMTSEEFVSMPVDEVLETMARKYIEAGESADAFGGITTLLGSRIGVRLIEAFKRLGTEGLDPFIEKTKDAAQGMRELAKAHDTVEKTGNQVTVWAASAAGAFAKVAERAAFMWKRLREGGGGKEGIWVGAREDVSRMREQETAAEKRRTAERAEAAKKTQLHQLELAQIAERLEKEKKAAKELAKLKEKAAENIEKLKEKAAKMDEKAAGRQKDILAGQGIAAPGQARVSALQAIGGIVGGVAGGGAQQARIEERQAVTLEAIRKLTERTNQRLAENKAEIVRLGEAY